jgi:hypothetical protein
VRVVRVEQHRHQLVLLEQPVREIQEIGTPARLVAGNGDAETVRDRLLASRCSVSGQYSPCRSKTIMFAWASSLEHEGDGPALPRAGAAEERHVPLEEAVPVGDRRVAG